MLFSKHTLSNGLRIVLAPMKSVESATVQIMIKAGSRNENVSNNGIAHFLEHMVFKGTKKYPTAQKIAVSVDSVGADINADTSKERTSYHIRAWERYLNLSFDILSGFVKNPILDSKEIEKEKGVILEEISMYEDLPMQKAPEVFEELLYDGGSLGMDVLGAKKNIKGMKRQNFVDFVKDNYLPKNMVLAIAGKFEEKQVLEMAERYFGDIPGGQETGNQVIRESGNLNFLEKPEIKILKRKTEQVHLVVGVRANPIGNPDQYKESVMNAILGAGMSSRMFVEIREKRGLAYYVRTYFNRYMDCGYFATRAGVKLNKVEESIELILEQFRNMCEKGKVGIDQNELKKAKEHLKGSLALDLEDTHSVSEFIGNQELFRDRIRSLEEIMEGVDKVTIEEVQEMAKGFFQDSKLNLALVGPVEKTAKLEELLKFYY